MGVPNLQLKEPVFDAVTVGERIKPRRLRVDDRYLRQSRFAFDDYREWTGKEGEHPVLSAMLLRDLHLLIGFTYDPARMMGLHQREVVWFRAPVRLGADLVLTGTFTDKFERRGKGYVVYDAEARDAMTGALLVRQVCTEIMRIPPGLKPGSGSSGTEGQKRVNAVWPTHLEPVASAEKSLPTGTPITSITKQAHQDRMSIFSGCDMQWSNIHTDVDRAHSGGYRDTLAAGLMSTCWLTEMASNFFGEKWLGTGHMENVYLKPVYRNDVLTCRGVVIGSETTGPVTRLQLEVWAVNQNGEVTTVGWASAAVD
jgi:acyl dehydratase